MLQVNKYTYRLLITAGNGKQYNITDFAENIGWEENEDELAVRITFTVRNNKTAKGRLSSLIKPGQLVRICSQYQSKTEEVARGFVIDWNQTLSLNKELLEIKCYDELYNLQESQDNIFFSSGIGTKSAIKQIFKKWGIPIGKYQGPDVTHGKLVYRSEAIAGVLLQILDDAKKKGGEDCVIRCVKGKVNILPKGSNQKVYHFADDTATLATHKISTSGMVTRVIVIGEENKEGRRPLEATVNGQTKYGIRQKIYSRGSDESLSDAKTAAKEILKESGKVKQEIKISAPNIPGLRKGDMIHVKTGTLSGNYYIKGIQHELEKNSMNMFLEKAAQEDAVNNNSSADKKERSFLVGDVVTFYGGTYYVSSSAGSKGYSAKAGKAKITLNNASGAHPWHLIHIDGSSKVYGWVDEGTFE